MRVCINYCKNCGAEYRWQASGNHWSLDTPKTYNDEDYCPECKQSILEALYSIEKKSEVKFIDVDYISLDTLLEWDKLKYDEHTGLLPLSRRVFAEISKNDLTDSTRTLEIDGRDEHKGKIFRVSFWEKTKDIRFIKVKARVDMDGKLIKYEL